MPRGLLRFSLVFSHGPARRFFVYHDKFFVGTISPVSGRWHVRHLDVETGSFILLADARRAVEELYYGPH